MNTSQRIANLQHAADRAGFPPQVMQGLWAQLNMRNGRLPGWRDGLLTRWEETAKTWPAEPVSAEDYSELAAFDQHVI